MVKKDEKPKVIKLDSLTTKLPDDATKENFRAITYVLDNNNNYVNVGVQMLTNQTEMKPTQLGYEGLCGMLKDDLNISLSYSEDFQKLVSTNFINEEILQKMGFLVSKLHEKKESLKRADKDKEFLRQIELAKEKKAHQRAQEDEEYSKKLNEMFNLNSQKSL